MLIVLLISSLAVALAVVLGVAVTRLVLYPVLPADLGGVESLDAEAHRIAIPLADGDHVEAWHLPGVRRGAVLLLHGFGRTHQRMWRYGAFLNHAGYDVLAFDFRSSRRRDRKPTTLGHHELLDAQGALDWLRALPSLDGQRIGLLGESLGGSIALLLAARNPDIAAVVVDGAFAHATQALEDSCQRWAGLPGRPTAAFLRWVGKRLTGHDPGRVDVAAAAATLAGRPVMVIHSSEDDRLSPAHATALWHASGSRGPLWLIHGAGHNEGWRRQRGLYEELLLAFLERPLRDEGPGLPGGPRATAVVRRPHAWTRWRRAFIG
jgi:pimeloyl-ACP methyl ester carboxylesterase